MKRTYTVTEETIIRIENNPTYKYNAGAIIEHRFDVQSLCHIYTVDSTSDRVHKFFAKLEKGDVKGAVQL